MQMDKALTELDWSERDKYFLEKRQVDTGSRQELRINKRVGGPRANRKKWVKIFPKI